MTVQIVKGDSLNLSPAFVSQFHFLYTDAPYSEHVHANATSQSARGGTRKRDLGFVSLSYRLRRKMAQCASLVQRWSVMYSDVESANTLAISCQAAGAEYVRTMPWVRWSMPQLSGDRPPQGFESLVVTHRAGPRGKPIKKHWNGPGNLTHLDELALRGEGKHKCEKPLDQALRLVSYFSDPGENVLDLFSGSGVIALACYLLGRNCFAIELEGMWAEAGKERIACAGCIDPGAVRTSPAHCALTERDRERVTRWLTAKDEPTAQQTEGPSVARAQARARDKEHVARITGL